MKSGPLHLFKYQPNGVSLKPVQPTLTLKLLSSTQQKKDPLIPALRGELTDNMNMIFAYGMNQFNIGFDEVVPDFAHNEQFKVVKVFEEKKSKEQKDGVLMKMATTEMEKNVEYAVPGNLQDSIKILFSIVTVFFQMVSCLQGFLDQR